MLLQAAVHVRMAEAQQKWYVYYTLRAEDDALTNKIHGLRTYVLVVDFGQEMQLPAFNFEQPGPV